MESSPALTIDLAKYLQKAVIDSDRSKILSILQTLSETDITTNVLRQTNLGKTVNKLKKQNSNKEIVELSKSLITKWKNMVQTQQQKKTKKNKKSSHKNNKLSKKSKNDSSRSQSVTSDSNDGSNNKEDSANHITPLEDQIQRPSIHWETGDSMRDRVRQKLIDALRPCPDKEEYAHYMEMAVTIERELMTEYPVDEEHGGPNDKYIQQFRDIAFNVKKNAMLKDEILTKRISPMKLVVMSSLDMASQQLKDKRDKEKKWAMEEARSDLKLKMQTAMTDEYRCGKCKKRKCKYSQAQTRGADEPMTTFVSCLNCGNRWKC